MNRIIYAIGDIHGEADRLKRLHDRILTDIARGRTRALIVHLGDMIDRGPDSRGVIETIMTLQRQAPAGVEAAALMGNHEAMMLTACAPKATPSALAMWCANGGDETIQSYGGDPGGDWRYSIDEAHLAWLARLPTHRLESARRLAFVHAGVDPDAFPHCDREVHLWTRSKRFMRCEEWPERPELHGWTVVHGHTPVTDTPVPEVARQRVNLDTGAVYGGPLSCGVFAPGESVRFIQVHKRELARC